MFKPCRTEVEITGATRYRLSESVALILQVEYLYKYKSYPRDTEFKQNKAWRDATIIDLQLLIVNKDVVI